MNNNTYILIPEVRKNKELPIYYYYQVNLDFLADKFQQWL